MEQSVDKEWLCNVAIPVAMGILDICASRVCYVISISSDSSPGNAVLFRFHWLDISCGANHPSVRNHTSEV